MNKQSTRWCEKSQFKTMLKDDKSVDSSWIRRWYWHFGTLQKPTRCSETANCWKTWRVEKKFVRQNRKEFCYTSRRMRERGPNSHMPFKSLSFSLFQFNVSLKLDLSHEFFQQIDHYPFITTFPVLQWKSAKAALRKQLHLPLKEKRRWNTIPISIWLRHLPHNNSEPFLLE